MCTTVSVASSGAARPQQCLPRSPLKGRMERHRQGCACRQTGRHQTGRPLHPARLPSLLTLHFLTSPTLCFLLSSNSAIMSNVSA